MSDIEHGTDRSDRAADSLEVVVLVDGKSAPDANRIAQVAKALLRVPLDMLTQGIVSANPAIVIAVRDRFTDAVVFEHSWGRDQVDSAESDYKMISSDLIALDRQTFLTEYGASDE